jgi:CBS domain-containing protein
MAYDPLEQALLERTAEEIETKPFITVPASVSVHYALETMREKDVGCLLVTVDDQLVGMFTERDVLDRVAENYQETRNLPLNVVMTRNPVVVYDTDPSAAALCAMAASGYRHVPVLDSKGKIVGIVSPLRMTSFIQEHLDEP